MKKIIKKVTATALATVMTVGLTACGGSGTTAADTATDSKDTAAATDPS